MAAKITTKQLYKGLDTIFMRVQKRKPDSLEMLLEQGLTIQMRLRNPRAIVTLDGSKNPVDIDYGATKKKPDITLKMTTRTLNRIMKDEIGPRKALEEGLIESNDNVRKLRPLFSLLREGEDFYAVAADHLDKA